MDKKTGSGICPKCGSYNIDYLDADWQDDFFFHDCVCRDCDMEFTEVYKLVYDGFNTCGEDGKEHLFDSNGEEM